jgi:hypothetical protein
MSKKWHYTVKTIYLANYYEAAQSMVRERRNPANSGNLISALKRLELADQTLENELNRIAERGYELADSIVHRSDEYKNDLVVTAIFAKPSDSD